VDKVSIIKDLSNQKFGRLTALKPIGSAGNGSVMWECLCDCGNTTVVRGDLLRAGKTKSCKCLLRDESRKRMVGNNFGWRGGTKISAGYARIRIMKHKRADVHGYVLEHVLIMEQMLGREMYPDETIHHCDGNTLDNRPYNLRLFPSRGAHTSYHLKLIKDMGETWIRK
jgi:hypothetical protein